MLRIDNVNGKKDLMLFGPILSSMIEVEIKARADHEAVVKRLREQGASYEKSVRQSDTFYNAPHRDFAVTDEAVRIRRQGDRAFLTYKGKKMDTKSKTRKEVEVEIDDGDKMEDILLSLGFRKTFEVNKCRDIYHIEDAEVTVDKVDGLGDFIELETKADDAREVPDKVEKLVKTMRGLGVDGELIQRSYLEMILEKKV